MNLRNFGKTWDGAQAQAKWNHLFIVGLIVIVLLMTILLARRDTIVTIVPFTLTDEQWVTENDSSAGYKEAWGFMLAQLFGNVTPATVGFVKERVDRLLSPAIYSDVMNVLEVQARQIKADRVSLRFEPRFVEYEPKTKKVFVYGYSFTKGMGKDQEKRSDRTYEFDISISNYLPVLDFMETYEGRPRTTEVLQRLQRREERRSER